MNSSVFAWTWEKLDVPRWILTLTKRIRDMYQLLIQSAVFPHCTSSHNRLFLMESWYASVIFLKLVIILDLGHNLSSLGTKSHV